ncbi:MAG TPA: MmgE/PrpD family protein [Hyphomicrobiales bacterium]|nr:MmgE/PrpD family protein [Hyphomicrobiales bacterium]
MAEETARIAGYVAAVSFAGLPPAVVRRATALALDFLGSAVRARAEAESTPAVLAAMAALGLAGPGEATVMGDARRYPAAAAALLNGTLGHSLDFDDTHAASSLHPSAPVVPAALAAAEMTGAAGADVVAAIVAGYEVCCRLGLALDPTAHYARGFHPTATAGTFGAAAAAGKLLGLDAERLVAAFGIAASQAAGSLQFLENGAWNKRFQVGAAAMNGLIAATLAREGFRGAAAAIEGQHGFLRGYSDGADPDRAVAGLGVDYETLKIGVKPYPCCRYAHAALDGLLALRREHALSADAVERVEIGLHRNGIVLTADPPDLKRHPRNVVEGQFSMFFTAAVALDRGAFGWDDYARLGDPAIGRLAERVTVAEDPALAGRHHPFGAHVRIVTKADTFERLVPDPSGEPGSFPDDDAIRAKFLTLAEPVLGAGAARFASAFLDLDAAPALGDVLALARPQAAPA